MSVITRIGKEWPVDAGHPNCQVDTGGKHCVRTEHMAYAAKLVGQRQDRERAALAKVL